MKTLIVLLLIIISNLSVLAASDLKLVFDQPLIKQGELVNAKLIVPLNQMQGFNFSKIENSSLADTLYFMEVSPLIKKEGKELLEADTKVIFTKVPKTAGLSGKIHGEEISLFWNSIEVQPTEGTQELLFSSFEIKKKSQYIFWIVLIIVLLIIFFVLLRVILTKQKKKKAHKENMIRRKEELLACRDYEEVVKIWQQRQEYFSLFPHIIEPFQKLEKELYKHQFKPKQTEQEKIEIMDAYRTFKRSVEGGFIGI